jgi:hypothetical protein
VTLAALLEERRKLLWLYYADEIAPELFSEEQTRLTAQIQAMRLAEGEYHAEQERAAQIREQFDAIAAYLTELDLDALWDAATESERRVLIDELIEAVEVHDDHLEVTMRGAPRLYVTLAEVGLGRQGDEQSCRRGDLNPHALAGTRPST